MLKERFVAKNNQMPSVALQIARQSHGIFLTMRTIKSPCQTRRTPTHLRRRGAPRRKTCYITAPSMLHTLICTDPSATWILLINLLSWRIKTVSSELFYRHSQLLLPLPSFRRTQWALLWYVYSCCARFKANFAEFGMLITFVNSIPSRMNSLEINGCWNSCVCVCVCVCVRRSQLRFWKKDMRLRISWWSMRTSMPTLPPKLMLDQSSINSRTNSRTSRSTSSREFRSILSSCDPS